MRGQTVPVTRRSLLGFYTEECCDELRKRDGHSQGKTVESGEPLGWTPVEALPLLGLPN
jgi:hypothetical protein